MLARYLDTARSHARVHLDTLGAALLRRQIRGHVTRRGSATLDIHVPRMGLFAHFSWVLIGLAWAEQNACRLRFECTNPQYNEPGREADWLHLVVEQLAPPGGRRFRVTDFRHLPFADDGPAPTRAEARRIVRRHLRSREDITVIVESWDTRLFRHQFTIGLHYRGSDKITEAPRAAADQVIRTVNEAVALLTPWLGHRPAVFLATDDPDFLKLAREQIRAADVHAVNDVQRSATDTGVHNAGHPHGPRLAREAMLDALLLSRTRLLLKTASALSGWSSLLGHDMPVVLLGEPYEHARFYPDNILAAEAAPDLPTAIKSALNAWHERTTSAPLL